jgi:hypothetical protein
MRPAFFHDPRWAHYVFTQPPDAGDPTIRAHLHGCFAYVPSGATQIAGLTDDVELWAAEGAQRFGTAFAGAAAGFAEAVSQLLPGAWLIVDGFERLTDAELADIHARRLNVAAYARNSRSHDVIDRALRGESMPRGRTMGLPEIQARVASAGFVTERCDRVASRWIFGSPELFPAEGTFARTLPPFTFTAVTRDALLAFLAHAYVVVFSAS